MDFFADYVSVYLYTQIMKWILNNDLFHPLNYIVINVLFWIFYIFLHIIYNL